MCHLQGDGSREEQSRAMSMAVPKVTSYENCGFAFIHVFASGCSAWHRAPAASLFMGMICLWEVVVSFEQLLASGVEISGGVGFPLLFLGCSS